MRNQIHVQSCFGFHCCLQTAIICKKTQTFSSHAPSLNDDCHNETVNQTKRNQLMRLAVTYKLKWEFRLCWAWTGLVLLETECRRFIADFIFLTGNLSRQDSGDMLKLYFILCLNTKKAIFSLWNVTYLNTGINKTWWDDEMLTWHTLKIHLQNEAHSNRLLQSRVSWRASPAASAWWRSELGGAVCY